MKLTFGCCAQILGMTLIRRSIPFLYTRRLTTQIVTINSFE